MATGDKLVTLDGLKAAYDKLHLNAQIYRGVPIAWEDGYYYKNWSYDATTGGSALQTPARQKSDSFQSAVLDCAPGDIFVINGWGGPNARVWAFTDASGNIIPLADGGITSLVGASPATNAANKLVNDIVTAPANAVKIYINNRSASWAAVSYQVIGSAPSKIVNNEQNINTLMTASTVPVAFDRRVYYQGSSSVNGANIDRTSYHKANGVTWTADGAGQQWLYLRMVEQDRISLASVTAGQLLGYALLRTSHRGETYFRLSGAPYTNAANGAVVKSTTVNITDDVTLVPFVVETVSPYTGSDTDASLTASTWFCVAFNNADNPQTVEVSYYPVTAFPALLQKHQAETDDYAAMYHRPYTSRLLFWGDSLTAGGGTNFPQVCANALGVADTDLRNCGVGGESANTIACRQGGDMIVIPAGDEGHLINRVYNYTEITDLFGRQLLFRGNSEDKGAAKVVINGQECTMTATVTNPVANSTLEISGYTSPDPDVQWTNIPLYGRCCGADFNGRVVIIFVGTNGAFDGSGTQTVASHMAVIDSMIANIQHKQYLIMGISKGNKNEALFGTTYPDEYDQAMLNHYGAKFFPTRKMLVQCGLAVANITPTAQDLTDIENGFVPTSLHISGDNTHLNAAGYEALGKLVAAKIKSLGYKY